MSLSRFQLPELARKVPAHRLPEDEGIGADASPGSVTGGLSVYSKSSWSSASGSQGSSDFESLLGVDEKLQRSKRTSLVRKPENVGMQATGIPLVPHVKLDPERVEHWNVPIEGEEQDFPTLTRARTDSLERKNAQERVKQEMAAEAPKQEPVDYFNVKPVAAAHASPSDKPRPKILAKPLEADLDLLPQPVETMRRRRKGGRAPVPTEMKIVQQPKPLSAMSDQKDSPPPLPQPFETVRRKRKPLARPIETPKDDDHKRTNLGHWRHEDEDRADQDLPQPFMSSRWANKVFVEQDRHARRSSTIRPGHQALCFFVPEGENVQVKGLSKRSQIPGRWVNPEEQVTHWSEPIDSAPPSPGEGPSPSSSACPSLSTSPTGSITSFGSGVVRKLGIQGRRESMDEGYGTYMGGVQRSRIDKRRQAEASKAEGSATGVEAPARGRSMRRRGRDDTLKADTPDKVEPVTPSENEYPLYSSPTRGDIKRPTNIDYNNPDIIDKFSVLLPSVKTEIKPAKVAPLSKFAKIPGGATAEAQQTAGAHHPSYLTTTPMVATPSPGITVASMPPRRNTNIPMDPVAIEKEVTNEFVENVYRYLSLNVPSIARAYDSELAEYTGMDIASVQKDRHKALREYIRTWLLENPEFHGGEHFKGGLW